jgi:uncharacterized membrane protein YgcG
MADMNDDDALVEPLGEPLAPNLDPPAADPFVPDELDDNGEQRGGINDHDVDDETEDGDEEDPALDEAQRANVLIATTLPIKFRQKHGPHGQARQKLIALKSLLRGVPGVISVVKQGIRDVPEFRVTFTNRMLGETALDHLSTEGFIVCGDTKYTPLYGAKHANLVSYDVRDCPFDANDNPTSMGFAAPDFDAVALLRDYVTTDRAWTRNLEVKFTTPGPAQFNGTLNIATSVMVFCYAKRIGVDGADAVRQLDTFIRIEDTKRIVRGVEKQTFLVAKFHNQVCALCGKVGHIEDSVLCFDNPDGISYRPPGGGGRGRGRGGGGRGGGPGGGHGGGYGGGPPFGGPPFDGDDPQGGGGRVGQGRNVRPRR